MLPQLLQLFSERFGGRVFKSLVEYIAVGVKCLIVRYAEELEELHQFVELVAADDVAVLTIEVLLHVEGIVFS